jgi:hypothetical protein
MRVRWNCRGDMHVVMVKGTEMEEGVDHMAMAARFAKVKLGPWKILLRCDSKSLFML